ncbi:MAG: hypothetical protein E7253_00315 [Lachnospiraceae bacterium]|nr:hypothetical protein [Lachnospiraceae bacterium]
MYRQNKMEQEYCSYISSLFQKLKKEQKMNQSDFGKQILHFQRDKKGKPIGVKGYVRGSVKNWMEGTNCPEYKESLICFALLDLCGSTEAVPGLSKEERDKRLHHVEKIMWTYLGKKLYSRYPPEAMLICAARGVISIKDIPVLLEEAGLDQFVISTEEAKKAGCKRVSDVIFEQICEADSKEELLKIIEENRIYYALGYKTLGIRIRDLWERKYTGHSFVQAVYVLAPRYQNTYRKMMDDSLQVSREFIIQFCSQMKFDRNMINEALDTARMRPLEQEETLPDYFEGIRNFSFAGRLGSIVQLAVYLGVAVKDREFLEEFRNLPYYFYLNHYFSLDSVEKQYGEMKDALEKQEVEDFAELIQNEKTSWGESLKEYIHAINQELNDWKEEERKSYKAYVRGYQKMYNSSRISSADFSKELKLEAECLYLLSTFSYGILLEKEFHGELSEEDLKSLKEKIKKESSIKEEEGEMIYNFLNALWVLFLEDRRLNMYKGVFIQGIRGTDEEPVSVYINWEDTVILLSESWKIALNM